MNCFCGMDDRRKMLRINCSQDRYQSFSSSQISSNTLVGFESAQNLIPYYFDRSCAVVINLKPRHMKTPLCLVIEIFLQGVGKRS